MTDSQSLSLLEVHAGHENARKTTFETRSHIWKHGTSFLSFENCGIAMTRLSTFFEQEDEVRIDCLNFAFYNDS